jgi:hypothetical protein
MDRQAMKARRFAADERVQALIRATAGDRRRFAPCVHSALAMTRRLEANHSRSWLAFMVAVEVRLAKWPMRCSKPCAASPCGRPTWGASCGTIRRKLFKIGAFVTIRVRRIKDGDGVGLSLQGRVRDRIGRLPPQTPVE